MLSENSKKVLLKAESFAKELGIKFVDSTSLFFALSSVVKSTSKNILTQSGFSSIKIREEIERVVNENKKELDLTKKPQQDIFSESLENNFLKNNFSDELKEILISASKISFKLSAPEISTIHLLIAITQNKDFSVNKIFAVFKKEHSELLKILDSFFLEIKKFVPSQIENKKDQNRNLNPKFRALRHFTTDLTILALENSIDETVGRKREIDRMITILNRRTKNNPILVGEPGVGKTAIVEGLARKIAQNDVPLSLAGKRVLSLDLASMVSGTKYRGEFEERIKNVINETIQAENVILFIDEIHTIVGAGSTEGSLDAANILKPALARGSLKLIGATTFDEFNKKIEKDPALERRFQKIQVDENSVEETIEILRVLKANYEAFHKVLITDEAIETATKLSDRYINDRHLPDKAIDLLDETCSKVSSKETVIPKELKDVEEKIREVVKKKNQAVELDNFELATKMREDELKLLALHKKIFEETFQKEKSTWPLVDEISVSETLSEATGIPIDRLISKSNLVSNQKSLFERLKERIFGQDEALEIVSKAILRAEAKLSDPKRPLGSFIFAGPTGVGKTELAKAIASEVYHQEDALIRFDMSEFSEKFNSSKLIGSPAGYVGYEEGGNLTEKVRRKPYSVVLFDEVEKAHPDIFNLLLQILDEGFLMDAKGRKVNFRNTIIILTSNIGTEILNQNNFGFNLDSSKKFDELESKIIKSVSEIFRPEFLNRIDKIISFKPLKKIDLQSITKKLLENLLSNLSNQKIEIDISDEVLDEIIKKSDTEKMGARSIKRTIEKELIDKISELINSRSIKKGDKIFAYVLNNEILIEEKTKLDFVNSL